jgi:hypothetical protein
MLGDINMSTVNFQSLCEGAGLKYPKREPPPWALGAPREEVFAFFGVGVGWINRERKVS